MMRLTGFVLTLIICTSATAQENSPYSRYGLGDLTPNQNIINRGMGGISAGYSDYQSVNFVNPASYGNLSYLSPATVRINSGAQRNTIFDFGLEADTRTLKSINPTGKFSTTNLNISYVQLGMPIKLKKANKKGIFLGIDLGLRPVSRVNYKILTLERKGNGVNDSLATLYEGSGGLSEAMLGAGLRIKNFNIGFNSGYRFGNKTYSTKLSFINDTVTYYQSNKSSKANFGGIFLNVGTQYEIHLKNKALLRLGAYAALSQKLHGSQDILNETVNYDASGAQYRVDSVYQLKQDGTVQIPSSWGAGFIYQDSSAHWSFGADYEKTNWGGYRYFDSSDRVQNTWKIRGGVEYFPASNSTPIKKYFSFVKYRAGFYYGPDYINLGNKVPEYGFTFGASFPLKLRKSSYYETQISYLNTAVEIGSRGNKQSSLRESIVRISVGFSLGDLWFNRSKYY
jgi:hypothetical protein